jgi:hypothetical protein
MILASIPVKYKAAFLCRDLPGAGRHQRNPQSLNNTKKPGKQHEEPL